MPITRSQLLALPSPKLPSRTTGIEGWVQEVASSRSGSRRQLVEISANIRAQGPKSQRLKSRQPIPRHPISRQPNPHQPTTSEKRGTKRKSTMDDSQDYIPEQEDEAGINPQVQKRGRGRPPKVIKNPAPAVPILGPTPQVDAQTTASGSTSHKTSRKSSPRKGAKYIDQPLSTINVDMRTLETCSPSVRQMTDTEAKKKSQIPAEVIFLLKKITSIPHGVIPRALQSSYVASADTPCQSRTAPEDFDYQPAEHRCPYPEARLSVLKERVTKVLDDAAFDHKSGAHEGQWGIVMHRLLGELEDGPNGQVFRTLNVEKCSIEPEEMRPVLPNGTTMGATVSERQQPSCSARTTTEDGETVGKMVDYGLTILLSVEERLIITTGFANLRPNERTLNQSLGYISHCPLFLNIELKKTQSNRDPEVQLAIWALGGLRKMLHHGWPSHMPMPAIALNGHKWDCYVFFEANKNLIMLGPYPMGTTSTISGIWRILYYLNVFVEWGRNEYRRWFEETVLRSLQKGGADDSVFPLLLNQ